MNMTIGEFHGLIEFCHLINNAKLNEGDIVKIRKEYFPNISFDFALEISQQMNLVVSNSSGKLTLDKEFKKILNEANEYFVVLRYLLRKYIFKISSSMVFSNPKRKNGIF